MNKACPPTSLARLWDEHDELDRTSAKIFRSPNMDEIRLETAVPPTVCSFPMAGGAFAVCFWSSASLVLGEQSGSLPPSIVETVLEQSYWVGKEMSL